MFCRNCGAQLTGAFCAHCRARVVQSPHVQAPAQPYSQPQPPGAKTASGLKILFVLLGVIVFLGMLSFGAIWYGWHKLKQTVALKGINLDTEVDRGAARKLDAC